MRPLLLATVLTLVLATPLASSQESRLPDIGSSAGELLTPARQAQLRQECLGLIAPEYVGLEAGFDAEAVKLQRAAEGVSRIFKQRFDFGRADQLATLAQG